MVAPVQGQGIFPTLTSAVIPTSDIAAVGTIFNVFGYDAVSDQDSNLSPYYNSLW